MKDAAFIDSAAPIQDAVLIEDPRGCDDNCLLLCCGQAPCGTLRRANLAAGIVPVLLEGPMVQEGASLLPLKANVADDGHSYLCFSHSAASRTDVLWIADDHFRPVHLPGVAEESSTLGIWATPGGLVQVTPGEVRLVQIGLPDAGLRAWEAPGSISHADAVDSLLAIAMGADIIVMDLAQCLGPVNQTSLNQQISALALLQMCPNPADSLQDTGATSSSGQSQDHLFVAVGTWVSNSVSLLRTGSLKEELSFSLGDEQPRSLALLRVPGSLYIVVGTSTGTVVIGGVDMARKTVGLLHAVKLGSTAIDLFPVAAHGETPGHLIVHGSEAALLRPSSYTSQRHDAQLELRDAVEAVRLHLGKGCAALAPIHTAAIPQGLAWVSLEKKLMFGLVDPKARLRWSSAVIGDTPLHAAYHRTTKCLVVLAEDYDGHHFMRLVDSASLCLVGSQRLDAVHRHCGVLVADLPCSSATMQEGADCESGGATRWKEFIVLWSYLVVREEDDPGLEGTQGLLSVFEIARSLERGGDFVRYSLKLHGTCPLPSVPHACTVVQPGRWADEDCSGQEEPGQDSAWHITPVLISSGPQGPDVGNMGGGGHRRPDLKEKQDWPVLLVGCHDGVRAYRLFVDDACEAGRRAVEEGLRALSNYAERVPEAPLDGTSAQEDGQPAADSSAPSPSKVAPPPSLEVEMGDSLRAAIEHTRAAVMRDWRQRLNVMLVGSAQAHSQSTVVSLASVDNLVLATEFLGSVTVFRGDFTVRHEKRQSLLWAPLIPISADLNPIFVQALMPISRCAFLAAVHPDGLVILHQDMFAEEAQAEAWRRELISNFESGREAGGAGTSWVKVDYPHGPGIWRGDPQGPGVGEGGEDDDGGESDEDGEEGRGLRPPLPSMPAVQPLMVGASCRLQQSIAGFCCGGLGLRLRSVAERASARLLGAGFDDSVPSSGMVDWTEHSTFIYYTDGGAVGVCHPIAKDDGESLMRLQLSSSELRAHPGDAKAATGHRRADAWEFRPEALGEEGHWEAGLAANAVDGDSVEALVADGGALERVAERAGLEGNARAKALSCVEDLMAGGGYW
ncbi:unnamed protein product [Ostreobium quekettii]|uniref:RSE1/DDB1/CPSF1 second beta-propeller domain-containing protein n=1 Tax=Ostreobium quekettii TaxID=121088 RepID=A0A8S1IZ60_9CHLO|nr:unnamed protein product [Ostreobium quekettii]